LIFAVAAPKLGPRAERSDALVLFGATGDLITDEGGWHFPEPCAGAHP
jgi:hypothetical protein